MHILYLSQYFPPEMGAPSARVHECSRAWVRAGHEVTVVTGFAHHPTGIKAPQDRWRITRRRMREGIEVLRCYVYAAPNRGRGRRMISYASFMFSSALIGALRARRPDVVIATSPQLLCGCAGYFLARRFGAPFVFEVRDLWPESIRAVGALRDGWVLRGLGKVARFLYRHCDKIVTVGAGYQREIEHGYGIPASKFARIPNGVDPTLFRPAPRENAVRQAYGWERRRVILYLGTHGMAHALPVVLEAARAMRDETDKLFVFVGEGAEKEKLKALAAAWKLRNVQFIDQQPKERLPLFYAACDIGLVSLRDTPLFRSVLPSKIFEYLGMERPVLVCVRGEARRLVEEARAGFFVPPENPQALVRAIRGSLRDRERLAEMGRRGRAHVLRHYDRRRLALQYLEVLEALQRPSPTFISTHRRRERCHAAPL